MLKNDTLFMFFVLFSIVFLNPLSFGLYQLNNRSYSEEEIETVETERNSIKSSDIAGSDLYAESINAFVAGNKSIIKQSLFTNDTNILSQFDLTDPAFTKCNVLISATNGINPDIFPTILTESEIVSQYVVGFNNFVGFLYYDKEVDVNDAKLKAERALEIIRRKFMIDLIMVNVSEENFFPFVGYYPNWEIFLNELTSNFPMDGYWKALDINRLISKEYLENYHISSNFMLLNSLDFFESDFNISTDQINFNIDSLDLSFLQNLEMEELFDQMDNIIDIYGDLLNITVSESELEQFSDILRTFSLKNDSQYTTISIQYEGLSKGIQKVGDSQYRFDLWQSLGYEGDPLAPSEKIFIAFMSNIKINILCTEIIDVTPLNFKFYDYLIEQISLLFYLTGSEFDAQDLEAYSFDLFWVDDGGIKQSFVNPVNLNDPYDYINFLQQVGFQGFSSIPTGLVNPFKELSVIYNVSYSDPYLLIKKELLGENASYGAYRNFSYNISAKNVGDISAWGVPTHIPFELDFFLQSVIDPVQLDNVKYDMWRVINNEYPNQYESLEDFFNFDEDPRIFYFDSFGISLYDTFYPDYFNFLNLYPYNEDFDKILDIIYPEDFGSFIFPQYIVEELFMNENSIRNDDNWELEPGEIISYQINNYSIANLNSFTPFYSNNFTIESIPPTPLILSGVELDGTIPEMALSKDNQSWEIGSIEKFLEQRIDLEFIFKNDTNIDFVRNSLDRVSIIINTTIPDNLESLNFEIYDFEAEEFKDISQYLDSIINNTWTFSIVNNNESLEWLFYPLGFNNYTVLFRIICIDSEEFNITINDLDIEFSARDLNFNEDPGSRVVYSSSTGQVQFESHSNSILLNTFNAASIVAYSYLTDYNSNPGDLNTYNINLKNIGSDDAKNLNISLSIPGIIYDANHFVLKNSILSYYIENLAPYEEKTLNFTFYVPNSISIKDISILYYNPKNVQGGNSSRVRSITNEVYVSAVVDYKDFFPFVRTLDINYAISDINPINYPLAIGEVFNLTVNLNNTSPNNFIIPDVNIIINDQYNGLRKIENHSLYFENIEYNEIASFDINLKKTGWKGYFFPSINFIKGSEGKSIQIERSTFQILGEINFSIKKSLNRDQIEKGDLVIVNIEVENTGNIVIEDIKVNDIISYSQSDFSLLEGKLVNLIDSLEPNEKVNFNYTIKAKRQAFAKLNPASIKFYYLLENEVSSNSVNIKIITPKITQFFYLCFPILIVIATISLYIRQTRKYEKKKGEFERSERQIFELDSRETIFKVEHVLRESLTILRNKYEDKDFIVRKEIQTEKRDIG
ncbi:MAG: COG1361 S-layer family protein [Promethearchaeota archaeon]